MTSESAMFVMIALGAAVGAGLGRVLELRTKNILISAPLGATAGLGLCPFINILPFPSTEMMVAIGIVALLVGAAGWLMFGRSSWQRMLRRRL